MRLHYELKFVLNFPRKYTIIKTVLKTNLVKLDLIIEPACL